MLARRQRQRWSACCALVGASFAYATACAIAATSAGEASSARVSPRRPQSAHGRLGALRLRGGGATSGIWDTFNRLQAEGTHNLNETKAHDFNDPSITLTRSNEGVHFAVRCNARPFRGDKVEVVGVWSPPPAILRAVGNAASASMEVTVELEIDPSPAAQDLRRGLSTWRGHIELPPGEFRYQYAIRRDGQKVVDTVTRTAQVYAKPPKNSIMLATDLDGTMLGNQKMIDTFFRVWKDEYEPARSVLVYNTGRPLDSALGLIESGQLPQPDALICSEGTQIFWFAPPCVCHVSVSLCLSVCLPGCCRCLTRVHHPSPCQPSPLPSPSLSPNARTHCNTTNKRFPQPSSKRKPGDSVATVPDEEWRQALNTTWDWPRLKDAVEVTLRPYRKNIAKFLPLSDMEIRQPMIVIAIDSQALFCVRAPRRIREPALWCLDAGGLCV